MDVQNVSNIKEKKITVQETSGLGSLLKRGTGSGLLLEREVGMRSLLKREASLESLVKVKLDFDHCSPLVESDTTCENIILI